MRHYIVFCICPSGCTALWWSGSGETRGSYVGRVNRWIGIWISAQSRSGGIEKKGIEKKIRMGDECYMCMHPEGTPEGCSGVDKIGGERVGRKERIGSGRGHAYDEMAKGVRVRWV